MNRRKLIAGLFAVPFVAMFGKLAKAETNEPRQMVNITSDPDAIAKLHASTLTALYVYTWKPQADGGFKDLTAIPLVDDKFTVPAEYAGCPIWVPIPK